MSSFGERLKARRRMQEQSYRNMKRVRQKNMRVMNALDTEVRVLDTEIKVSIIAKMESQFSLTFVLWILGWLNITMNFIKKLIK